MTTRLLLFLKEPNIKKTVIKIAKSADNHWISVGVAGFTVLERDGIPSIVLTKNRYK